jgi:hypothetical protein
MDEHIISIITSNLSQKDLVSFSLINHQTYHYCKHTNVRNKKCNDKHITYHFTLSLIENARLSYSMNLLSCVKILYDNEISLHIYRLQISLTQTCGTTTRITFGRDIIINSIVYSYDIITGICDIQKETLHQHSKVCNLNDNKERLEHKLNSILSHKYVKTCKIIKNNVKRDCHFNIIKSFEKDIEKYFIKLIKKV